MQCFQKTEIFLEIRDPTFYFWTFINVQKKKLRSIFVKFFQGSWTPDFHRVEKQRVYFWYFTRIW
jgi:hypothetical protein